MLIKSLLLVVLTTSFGFFGLLGISTNFLHNETKPDSEFQTQQTELNSVIGSTGFEQFANEIKNTAIDYSSIEKEIQTINNEIQKSYLLSLLCYRQQKYDESYSLLLNSLKNAPNFSDYYVLLINNAKILNKLDEVKKQVDENLKSNSNAFNLVNGLRDYNSQNLDEAIEFFQKESSFKEKNYWLANSYRLKGNYKKAVEVLRTRTVAPGRSR